MDYKRKIDFSIKLLRSALTKWSIRKTTHSKIKIYQYIKVIYCFTIENALLVI